ncbi:MAG TPA: hypothetical protein PKX25_17235, partial [Microthrixaceae bacterium]|nr:hypothetical protein [Microthrixaceae bacterium]
RPRRGGPVSRGGRSGIGVPPRAVLAVLRRPDLWWTGVRQALVLAPDGWWRRPPHLPLPDPAYLRFRMVTAHGGDGSAHGGDGSAHGGDGSGVDAREVGRELVTYLEWCRSRPLG